MLKQRKQQRPAGRLKPKNNRSLVLQSVEEIQRAGGKLAFREMRCGDSYQESHESKMINADLEFLLAGCGGQKRGEDIHKGVYVPARHRVSLLRTSALPVGSMHSYRKVGG